MKIYYCKNTSPYTTLVLEEMLLKDENVNEDILYFYQHDNAIIIGRNQNIYEEVKVDVVEKENIEVYRRLSGGGAVYHDLGNINFSFITKKSGHSYEKFLTPIIEFFQSLGLEAEFKGRNDVLVNGAKVSGNAQAVYKNKMVHHGTILFDANLAKLSEVLIPSKLKIESKGIKSIRQRVTNILDELNFELSHDEFIKRLIDFFENKYENKAILVETILESPEKKEIFDKLSNFRKSKEWVFGHNPMFKYENKVKTSGGIVQVKANIEQNTIKSIKFEGDFLSQGDAQEISSLLVGKPFERPEIEKIFNSIENFEEYFGSIPRSELLDVIFGVVSNNV